MFSHTRTSNRRNAWTWGVGGGLVTAVLVSVGGAATASDSGTFTTVEEFVELDAGELSDLRTAASDRGMSIEAAIALFGWHDDFATAVQDIRTQFPDEFSGAAITAEGPHDAWIAFRAEIPSGIEATIAPIGVAIELRSNTGFSERAADLRLTDVHYAILDAGFDKTISEYDPETGLIRVTTQRRSEDTGLTDAQVLLQMPEVARASDVQVVLGYAGGSEDSVYGGGRIEGEGSNSLKCTAGVAALSGTTRGMVTAQHCSPEFTHENTNGSTEYDATQVIAQYGYWGDFRWYTTTQWESDNFYYNTGSHRDATAVGSPVAGQLLYRYGHSSGQENDTVYGINKCKWSLCHLTAMNNDEANGGDSGGPWFSGSKVYGIHHGNIWIWFNYRDVFSPLINVGIAIGVDVATS